MIKRYVAGETMACIARAAGVTRQAVEQRLRPAKAAGVIPADLGQTRRAQRAILPAALAAARERRWPGYTDAFQRAVVEAAAKRGTAPAAREWGVSETSIRLWRARLTR